MEIHVSCHWCGKEFQIDEKYIWKKWTCPKCKTSFSIQASGDIQEVSKNSTWENSPSEENSDSQVKVHEQKVEAIQAEKTWFLAPDNLSKIAAAIFGILFIVWNIYAFFHNQKVSEAEWFAAEYNMHMAAISEGTASIESNILSTQKALLEAKEDISLADTALKDFETMWETNEALYTEVFSHFDILENETCMILESSHLECISFVKTYKWAVKAIERWDITLTEKLTIEAAEKSQTFVEAAIQDGIMLWW